MINRAVQGLKKRAWQSLQYTALNAAQSKPCSRHLKCALCTTSSSADQPPWIRSTHSHGHACKTGSSADNQSLRRHAPTRQPCCAGARSSSLRRQQALNLADDAAWVQSALRRRRILAGQQKPHLRSGTKL